MYEKFPELVVPFCVLEKSSKELLVCVWYVASLSPVFQHTLSLPYTANHLYYPYSEPSDEINKRSPPSLPLSQSMVSESPLLMVALNPPSSHPAKIDQSIHPAVISTPQDKSPVQAIQVYRDLEPDRSRFPIETMESAFEFEDVKPNVDHIDAKPVFVSNVPKKRGRKRKSDQQISAFGISPSSLDLPRSTDEFEGNNDIGQESDLWAPTYQLIRKQKLGNSVQCLTCKYSVQANLAHMRKHVNAVHKRFNRYRCKYCGEEFLNQAKAVRHEREIHSTSGVVVPLEWDPSEVAEIEKAMVECFGFNV
uniref:C2H2-type domain-containing protein n=1 Tax=Angiostrongylus cantonensis TaxID=6313 RepID=A0A0K0CYB6_ANGCA